MPPHHSAIVEAEGHLIDSGLLNTIFTTIVEQGASYRVDVFEIGRTNDEMSRIRLEVETETPSLLTDVLQRLTTLGCHLTTEQDAVLKPSTKDCTVPDDFYSTTNHRTYVRLHGQWIEVAKQRMDGVVVVDEGRAVCRKLRDVRVGDQVVCGLGGIRIAPELLERDRPRFGFMTNDVSSERRVEATVARVAAMMRDVRDAGGRIAVVAGPVVIHTGGVQYLCELLRAGYVDLVLAGNALAVHDVEFALSGTSLGVDLGSGVPVEQGHRNHMSAINAINKAGSIREAVASGALTSGIMYECETNGVPYILAGSIRDDGPMPETIMDLVEAQDRYSAALADNVQMVLMLSTMLHSIGVGNMLPSWVKVVCVDINPAVVTKLADRGSNQTVGIVTDVGLFLHHLAHALAQEERVG